MHKEIINIVLVEDEPDHADLIIAAFDDDGSYKFNVFENIRAAKEYLNYNIPDILITDWKLPDGEGLELINQTVDYRYYPIIVMTSFGNEKFAVEAMKKGATDYIVKSPHSFETMPHTVDRTLREWRLILEKKNAEESRQEMDLRFKAFFENASVGMALVSIDNIFLVFNDILSEILNYEKDELLNSNLLIHLYPDDVTPVFNAFNDLQTGAIANSRLEVRFVDKRSNIIWTDLNISILRDKRNNPTYFTFVVQDISERKNAEAEVLKLNSELEKKVDERTFQLNRAMEDLTQSNEELRVLNAAVAEESIKLIKLNEKLAVSENNLMQALNSKNKFFSIIAHDLRNPIGYFSQITETLSLYHKNMTGEELTKMLGTMEKSAKFTMELLNNLLDWAKSQTGNIQFQPSLFNLPELLNNSCSLLKLNAEKKNISIEFDINPNLIIKCDKSMFETIIRNIVSNSIKFTNEGGKISVKAFVAFDTIKIIIADNGIGISSDGLEKLFKIEHTISTKGTNNEVGAGLGLILTKEFIDYHSGKISVQSSPGKGTTFELSFPGYYE
eukprot:TRINITY_DN6212_c0_g1_i1.p1 TRINITY_DN6212_c0_g1~~TRINITY_DN6212_c0_g1_i1.p1  ORF type:complete len:558 (+),score=-26.50 TRINITY_DN6212_c0_g1_i1:317-1990(+)